MNDLIEHDDDPTRLKLAEAECTAALCALFKFAQLVAMSGEGDEHHAKTQQHIKDAIFYGAACGVTGGAATEEDAQAVKQIREMLASAALGVSQGLKAEKAH